MNQLEMSTHKIANGLGYGEGFISGAALREEAGEDAYRKLEQVIESNVILVPVDRQADGKIIDDDGCSDGRKTKRVFKGLIEKNRSLNRAKVFGGGAVMTASTLIGSGHAKGKTVNGLMHSSIAKLKDKMINFGAHTADQVSLARKDIDCGCGAIDKAPENIHAAVEYEESIAETIRLLGIDASGLDEVFKHYQSYDREIAGQTYVGTAVMSEIVESGKIVKQLEGSHSEAAIVLNMVRDYTVNQGAVRQATNGKLDIFAVDVWRMRDYAKSLYASEGEQKAAFLSQLVYTLGTASVLTKGDLAVYSIDSARVAVTA